MSQRLQIRNLGARGDGIAETENGVVYVPYTLPGEVVMAEVKGSRGRLLSVEEVSPQRVEPISKHFGVCGGCSVQHLAAEAYAQWKRETVVRALQRYRIHADIKPLVTFPPRSRRRVTLTTQRVEGKILLGFNATQTHRIVDVKECPVALPSINAALNDLRELAGFLLPGREPCQMTITSTQAGLDLSVTRLGRLSEYNRGKLIELTLIKGFARLSIGGEVVVEREKPWVLFGDVSVDIAPGGFLQAIEQVENLMAKLVLDHLEGAKCVADLFAGSGAFVFRLAPRSRVHAVEGERVAVSAMDSAMRRTSGLKPVQTEERDLFHRPLNVKELAVFDGIVFDPPRAGAEAQCQQIARSNVQRVVAVSCDLKTFARDLAILIDGGYRVASITPIDQFLWSSHVEMVALLERSKRCE